MASWTSKKGTPFETSIGRLLTPIFPEIRRTGSAAYGDGDFAETDILVIDAKNHKEMKLGYWITKVEKVVKRFEERGLFKIPVIIHKRRSCNDRRAYVTLTVEGFVQYTHYLRTGEIIPFDDLLDPDGNLTEKGATATRVAEGGEDPFLDHSSAKISTPEGLRWAKYADPSQVKDWNPTHVTETTDAR